MSRSPRKQPKTPVAPERTLPKRGRAETADTFATEQQQDFSPIRGAPGSARSRSRASMSSDLTDLSDASEEDDGGVSGDVVMHNESHSDDPSSPTRGATNPSYTQLFSPVHSRVGSTIARPNYSSGIRTYGRKRSLRPASEVPQTPEAGPSRIAATPNSSPLTPLTPTPSPTKRKAIFSPLSVTTRSPSKRKRDAKEDLSGTNSTLHESPSKRRTIASKQSVTSSPQRKTTRSDDFKESNTSPRRKVEPSKADDWSLDCLGTLVWVRIDKDNVLTRDSSRETYWWPAKVENNSSPDDTLRVTLLCPPSPSKPSSLVVSNPSKDSIVSQTDNLAKLRFDSDTYRVPLSPTTAISSPRKKHLNDLDSRWHAARSHMMEEDEILNDGFPSSITAVFSHISGSDVNQKSGKMPSLTPGTPKKKTKGERSVDPQTVRWSPPSPDITMNIPGELVLSKDKKSRNVYWPARVDAFILPKGPGEEAKYRLTFLDNQVIEVTRDMFLIYDQEQFGTCQLGKFESLDTHDTGETLDQLDYHDLLHPDPDFSIPEPTLPPPPSEQFCQLCMRDQLAFVTPILTRVAQRSYTPAEKRNRMFLSGGRSRAALSHNVSKGSLTDLELVELQKTLFKWACQTIDSFEKDNQNAKNNGRSLQVPEGVAPNLPTAPIHESSISEQVGIASDKINDRGNNDLLSTSDMNFSDSSPTRDRGVDSSALVPTSPVQLPPSSLPPSSITSELQEEDINNQTSREASIDPADQSPRHKSGRLPIVNSSQEKASDVKDNNSSLTQPFFVHLTETERINYITDVLLPEAILQLLLWRSGERTSSQPLPDEEELVLYQRGIQLTMETDFVFSVMRLRRAKEREIRGPGLQSNGKGKSIGRAGGSRSRPRMVQN